MLVSDYLLSDDIIKWFRHIETKKGWLLKSSTGKYYQALDHIRAVAVFVVFIWHFNHFDEGQLAAPLVFPLSLFTEGHTGVAIFMVLSGYLFAKLLGNKKINYPVFLYNRGLRLLPLLLCVLLIIAAQAYMDGRLNAAFFIHLLKGFVLPTLPNGGWSITVEFHFYLILPVLLITATKSLMYLCSHLLCSLERE